MSVNLSLKAALWAMAATTLFSLNDAVVKFLSGGYPLYQVIFFRSTVAMLFIVLILAPITGDPLRTRRLRAHLVRGLCIVVANFCFFLSLAALPLAEAVAIFFVAPLVIAVLSVVVLGESVGTWRWSAIGAGFLGVLVVLRPGTEAFQIAALLPLVAACGYATLHIMTRRLAATESATQLAFYIQSVFIVVSGVAGLALGHGRANVIDHPSAEFLLRAWTVPTVTDSLLIVALGCMSAFAGYCISSAYRGAEAAFVAPFEYLAMPLSLAIGYVAFAEVPDAVAFGGIALILMSGLVLVWREARVGRRGIAPRR